MFGYKDFRPGQREVIEKILSKKDGLVLMPTAGGKTLSFVLPALLVDGMTIIVIPTLSLMQDLYFRLNNICTCVCLSSDTPPSDRDSTLHSIMLNSVKLLLVTPESLQIPSVLSCLSKAQVAELIVDESHVCDEWGFQFRPSYLTLGDVRKHIKCPCVGFTATANERTIGNINKLLSLSDPFLIKRSFERKNLYFHVREKSSFKNTCNEILELCTTCLHDQSVIIYCSTPTDCNKVCYHLIENNLKCVTYHGQVSPSEKSDNLQRWRSGDVLIIIATKSLGMGIDKSDVRSVIHFSFPSSIGEYYQQVGRGARDGHRADCYLFFKFSDRFIHLEHINKINDATEARNARFQLNEILKMFINKNCLNKVILNYFGEDQHVECNRCTFCMATIEEKDITLETRHSILLLQGLITKLKGSVTFSLLAKVMTGSKGKEIIDKDLHQLPLYKCCKIPIKKAEDILFTLWAKDILHEESRSLSPGEKSNDILSSDVKVKFKLIKL